MSRSLILIVHLVLGLSACDGAPAEEDLPATASASDSSIPEQVYPEPILASLGTPWSVADLTNGRRVYRQCQSCHTLGEGGRHLVGPNLYGLIGRPVGREEGFAYSAALRNADGVWTTDTLDQWLANPRSFLPGNRMSYAGLRNETDRRDVIGYMAVETAGP